MEPAFVETKLTNDLQELLSAGFSGIWLRSFEYAEAEREINHVCEDNQWMMHHWDADRGLTLSNELLVASPKSDEEIKNLKQLPRPAAAIRTVMEIANVLETDTKQILVIPNMHLYVTQSKLLDLQALQNAMVAGTEKSVTFIGMVPPEATIPVEIEKQMLVVDHELPTPEELWQIAVDIVGGKNDESQLEEGYDPENEIPLPEGKERQWLLEAAAGFTREEFSNAVALSLVRNLEIRTDELWDIKEQLLKKSGLLELTRSKQGFESVGGFNNLKSNLKQFFNSPNAGEEGVQARGVIMLGVPGTGKTHLSKCLGKEVDRPVLSLDIGKLMGSLVGQTEERTRVALKLADAMAPCILFVDKFCPLAA